MWVKLERVLHKSSETENRNGISLSRKSLKVGILLKGKPLKRGFFEMLLILTDPKMNTLGKFPFNDKKPFHVVKKVDVCQCFSVAKLYPLRNHTF